MKVYILFETTISHGEITDKDVVGIYKNYDEVIQSKDYQLHLVRHYNGYGDTHFIFDIYESELEI